LKKVVSRIMLMLLMIGMLTLALNIRLARANGVSMEIGGIGNIKSSEKIAPQVLGEVVFSFLGPDSDAAGLTWDGAFIWLADIWSGNIYRMDPSDGSVVSSFVAPARYPTGLAWDGISLWVVCEQVATAYKLDPSDGSVISSIHLPGYGESDPNSACITWDGEYLWHADYTHYTIYKLDPSDGSVVSSFASPSFGPSGLTWDGAYLWHSDYLTDTIYKLDPSDGSVELSFASPASHPWDLAWDGFFLWNADIDANTVYKIDVGVSPPVITATIDINPDALMLRSRGKWITGYIELPEGYNVRDINVSSILLNNTIPAEPKPRAIGDFDSDGIPDMMIKFSRADVISLILANVNIEGRFMTATLTVTGSLYDGTPFQGSDTIKIILPRNIMP
jgi:hypothetical protein